MNTRREIEDSQPFAAHLAWSALAVAYLGLVAFGITFHFIPPLIPGLISELGFGRGQAGLLMSLLVVPGIVLAIPAGRLVDRYGERSVGTAGLALMAIGTAAMTVSGDFTGLAAGRVVTGIGTMPALVAMQRTVTRMFAGRPIGLPMGLFSTGVPVGIVLVLNLAGPLSERCGWRCVALGAAVCTLLAGVVFWSCWTWLARRGVMRPVTETVRSAQLSRIGMGTLWLAGVVWLCANGAMTAFVTFAPDHYLDLGFATGQRGLLVSLPVWISAPLAPLIGALSDRRGSRAVFIGGGMLLMGICFALATANWLGPIGLGVGLGLALAGVVTPILTLPAQLLSPAQQGRAFGILNACAGLGAATLPPIAGLVRDLTGGYTWSLGLMATAALTGAMVAGVLNRREYRSRG